MINRRQQLAIAVGFFAMWLGILYAGADHPPPRGFIWIVLLCMAAAVLVFLRVPTYAQWAEDDLRFRLSRVLLDGVMAGFVFALIGLLVPGSGEPTVQAGWLDRAVWFIVLGIIGAANALIVYTATAVIRRLA